MHPLTATAKKIFVETSSLIGKLILIALIITTAGSYYAQLHNERVCINKELEKLCCELSTCKMNTQQLQTKAESLSNRWAILDRLNQNHSELSGIKTQQVELLNKQGHGALAHNEH